MLVRLSWLYSPFRPSPAPCPLPPAPPPPPQYSCSRCRSVTSADPRQAPLGAWGPPGSWSSSVATPAMPSSVGSRVIGPARRPAVVVGMAGGQQPPPTGPQGPPAPVSSKGAKKGSERRKAGGGSPAGFQVGAQLLQQCARQQHPKAPVAVAAWGRLSTDEVLGPAQIEVGSGCQAEAAD